MQAWININVSGDGHKKTISIHSITGEPVMYKHVKTRHVHRGNTVDEEILRCRGIRDVVACSRNAGKGKGEREEGKEKGEREEGKGKGERKVRGRERGRERGRKGEGGEEGRMPAGQGSQGVTDRQRPKHTTMRVRTRIQRERTRGSDTEAKKEATYCA